MADYNHDNGAIVYKALRDSGFTDGGAAGVAGNFAAESGFNTQAVGDGGSAKGLAQWHPDRWGSFLNWLGRQPSGHPGPYDLSEQLAWAEQEFHDYGIYDQLKNAPDAYTASSIMVTKFERPADQSPQNIQSRANLGIDVAKQNGSVLDKLKAIPGDVGGAVGGAAGSAAGAVADKVLGAATPILWKGLFVALGVGLLGVGVVKTFDVKLPSIGGGAA
jgi:Phage tail lysozyme